MAGYGALHDAAFVEGALDIKTKELIALSIAIKRECDGCIAAHGRNLARLGATAEEVAEMIGVAITMNGGPGLVWGAVCAGGLPGVQGRHRGDGDAAALAGGDRREAAVEMLDAVDETRLQPRRLTGRVDVGVAAQSSRNITVISRRARCAPRQKCGPGAPKP